MKLSWKQFWGLLWTFSQRIPVDQTGKLLDISKPTIYRWYGLFRQNLPHLEDVRLEGTVQMDEAYFGGKKKGVAIIAAKERDSSKVAAFVVPASSVKRTDIVPFIRQYVVPGSYLHTDGALIYKGIAKHWPVEHAYDTHRKGEFGKTSVIEGFWGSLRTFIRRMYHHVTVAKLPELLREYQCRLMFKEIFENPASLLPKLLTPFPFA
ncbi:MAG: IS1595 family transposase [bacterium]|nr:IS1595 family transposase [bacterium]